MDSNKTMPFRILMLIADTRLTEKAIGVFEAGHLPIQYQFSAHGTASSDIMDIIGLGGIEKNALVSILPKRFADKMLDKLSAELKLTQKNSGIAFTIPLNGINALIMKMGQHIENLQTTEYEVKKNMQETKYTMIAVIVNQGFSEDVMHAARAAGATGGTVFHNRCIVNEETKNFWGLGVQEEKETVVILASTENKLDIMKAISESCGMHSEAQGIVLSMPIDAMIGLEK